MGQSQVRRREDGSRGQGAWPPAGWPLEVESKEQILPERMQLCQPLDYNPLQPILDFWPPKLLRE